MAVPKLRFKEFDGDWDLKNLGDCFSLFSGYAFPSSASVDNGTKWLKIADVGIQEMTPNNLSFLPNNFTTKFPQFIVYKNDYVIALTRPILNKKLKIAKVGEFYDGALLNQRVAKIVSDNNNLDFIYSLLQKSKTVEELENSIAGTDPPNLSLNEVKGIVLGIPKVEEQTKIASFLSAVDEKISQLTRKHELLSQYKQGMMQKLFSQQIRFKADDGNEFGEWEEIALGKVKGVSIASGKSSHEKLELAKYYYYGSTGVIGYSNKYDYQGTRILIARVGHNAGYIYMVSGQYNVSDNTLILELPSSLDYIFIRAFLEKFQLNKLVFGTGQPLITGGLLKKVVIQVPCLEEQIKIANFLSSIDQKIEGVAQQIEQAKQWKKGLLQQMFV